MSDCVCVCARARAQNRRELLGYERRLFILRSSTDLGQTRPLPTRAD